MPIQHSEQSFEVDINEPYCEIEIACKKFNDTGNNYTIIIFLYKKKPFMAAHFYMHDMSANL